MNGFCVEFFWDGWWVEGVRLDVYFGDEVRGYVGFVGGDYFVDDGWIF